MCRNLRHTRSALVWKEENVCVRPSAQTPIDSLYKQLGDYQKTDSNKNLRALRKMLSRTYKFTGFTRAYVRAHLETYPNLAEYVQSQ